MWLQVRGGSNADLADSDSEIAIWHWFRGSSPEPALDTATALCKLHPDSAGQLGRTLCQGMELQVSVSISHGIQTICCNDPRTDIITQCDQCLNSTVFSMLMLSISTQLCLVIAPVSLEHVWTSSIKVPSSCFLLC